MTPKIRTLTIPEVCATLRIGRTTVYEMIRRRQLRSVKLRGRRLVRESDLERMLDRASE